MGILSRLARGARGFADNIPEAMRWNMPVANAMTGAVPGAMAGGALDQENPMRGALMGAGIGAGAMAAGPTLGVLRHAMGGAAEGFGAARSLAREIVRIAERDGVEAARRQVLILRQQDPELMDEALSLLRQGGDQSYAGQQTY